MPRLPAPPIWPLPVLATSMQALDAESRAAFGEPITLSGAASKRAAAKYLREHDPGMLDFLSGMAQAFGPMAEVQLSGYPDALRQEVQNAERAVVDQAFREMREVLA